MTHTHAERPGSSRPTLRLVLASAILPLVTAMAGAFLIWRWSTDLPDRIAIHWGTEGADSFASVATTSWLLVSFGVAFALIGLALSFAQPDDPFVARIAAATTTGTTAFVAALMVGLTAEQRGLADASDATVSGMSVFAAVIVGVAFAAVAVALVPRWAPPPHTPAPRDVPTTDVGESDLVVWTRSVAVHNYLVAILVATIGVVGLIGVISGLWWIVIFTLVLLALALWFCTIRVTVDRQGVTVTGIFDWPKSHTSLDEIVRARTAQVHPIRHFGGYGFRFAVFGPYRGAKGFVLRGGEAIMLERADGGHTLIVVDDAATAAGVINTLVNQRQTR